MNKGKWLSIQMDNMRDYKKRELKRLINNGCKYEIARVIVALDQIDDDLKALLEATADDEH